MNPEHADSLSRRRFLAASAGSAVALPLIDSPGESPAQAAAADAPAVRQAPVYQATGMKIGEVTSNSAIVWTRLTAAVERNNQGVIIPEKKGKQPPAKLTVSVPEIEGACPGAPGRVRVRYGKKSDLSDAKETAWVDVDRATDFTHHFALNDLEPDTEYHVAVDATGPGGSPVQGSQRGRFETAPAADAPSNLRFCVMTCQGYPDRDHRDGHNIYPSMLALKPKFVSLTGDVVYYDSNAPAATTIELARLHWERMFSLPRQVELLRNAASYWLKDDHDTLKDDSWPGQKAGILTYAEGQQVFREQTPMSEKGYRTFRWGRDLQVWLTDGRDYRSPNDMPDGPEKTIWGA
jgi:alkaline phosphatase D